MIISLYSTGKVVYYNRSATHQCSCLMPVATLSTLSHDTRVTLPMIERQESPDKRRYQVRHSSSPDRLWLLQEKRRASCCACGLAVGLPSLRSSPVVPHNVRRSFAAATELPEPLTSQHHGQQAQHASFRLATFLGPLFVSFVHK